MSIESTAVEAQFVFASESIDSTIRFQGLKSLWLLTRGGGFCLFSREFYSPGIYAADLILVIALAFTRAI